MISSGQTTPMKRSKNSNDVSTADIFETPDIAKVDCQNGEKWDGVECLPFID